MAVLIILAIFLQRVINLIMLSIGGQGGLYRALPKIWPSMPSPKVTCWSAILATAELMIHVELAYNASLTTPAAATATATTTTTTTTTSSTTTH